MKDISIFNKDTQVFVWGYQKLVQRMLDYDYASGKEIKCCSLIGWK